MLMDFKCVSLQRSLSCTPESSLLSRPQVQRVCVLTVDPSVIHSPVHTFPTWHYIYPVSKAGNQKSSCILTYFFKDLIYLFLERGEGREKEREKNVNVWLPLTSPQLGTWPTTEACALTGNWTGNPLVCKPALNPLSHTSQGSWWHFWVHPCPY